MREVSIFLAVVALTAGMVGCGSGESCALAITSTEGGSVTTPGEGMFTYGEATMVDLTAEAEKGYRFVRWTGDVDTIAEANAATTTITVNGSYFITANFVAVTDDSPTVGIASLRKIDISNAQGLMIVGSSTIAGLSTGSSETTNRLYKYTEDGNLEIVTMYDQDDNVVEYTSSLSPTEIIDLGSKLFISFNAYDKYWCPLSRAVFVDKLNGNAYMIGNNVTGSIVLHYNPCFSYRQIYSDDSDNIYMYIYGAPSGFYRVMFTDSGASGELLFAYEVDCNSPTFLADRHGNIAFEDSCKPWKIFTAGRRMSTITPDTFGYESLLSSTRWLINGQLRLDSDGMSATQYTNTEGIRLWQTDRIAYGANMTCIANSYGVIVYDEVSSNHDENVLYFYPDDWSVNSADYNLLVVANDCAYIATNIGIISVSLSDIDNIVWESNILDDVYKVIDMVVHSDHIVFNGKDPYLNNITARYDFDTESVTIIENYGKEDLAFNLIRIDQ